MGLVNQGIYTRVWVQNMKNWSDENEVPLSQQISAVPTQENTPQNPRKPNFKLESNSDSPSLKNKVHEGDFWGDKILGPGL